MKNLLILLAGLLSVHAYADDLAIDCQNGIALRSELPGQDGPVTDASLLLDNKSVSGAKAVARESMIIVTTSGREERQYIFSAHVDNGGECKTKSVSVYSVGSSEGRKLLHTESCTCDVD